MEFVEISGFGFVLLFILGGLLLVIAGLFVSSLLRPKRPNIEKLSTYECGEEPTGIAWGQFNNRFYIIMLFFVLFEAELLFLFPWSTVFGQKKILQLTGGLWGWFALVEIFIFVGFLVVGLAYVWGKGYLEWVKPQVKIPEFESKVPKELYDNFNERKYR